MRSFKEMRSFLKIEMQFLMQNILLCFLFNWHKTVNKESH